MDTMKKKKKKQLLTKLLLSSIFTFLICPVPLNSELSASSTLTGGEWHLLQASIGISAMHMQLLHNNKVVMFDRTDFGPSNLSLPLGQCRFDSSDTALTTDCTAHSLLYDIATNKVRPLMVQTDTWCSSGSVLSNGTLVQTGGFNDGDQTIRMIDPCENDQCDWVEYPNYLQVRRWYATNQILPDGRIIIVGGRRQFNYEFYPRNTGERDTYWLNFLRDTRDVDENNLYPFLHLLPDGNLFIFANTRSISLDYVNNEVVKEFPSITGNDPRNYPSSGSSVLLPLELADLNENGTVEAEVLICGGAPRGSHSSAEQGKFYPAVSTCGRLKVMDPNPEWEMEEMPMARVMGDMLILPTGDVIIVNGAGSGSAGWEFARDPVTTPVLYRKNDLINHRFSVMQASAIPRLYHSSAVLVPDGRVLVGGSNPHPNYNFSSVLYPTDLSLEAFSPPYLASEFEYIRPRLVSTAEIFTYGQSLQVRFAVEEYRQATEVSVALLAPAFTTHSLGMNQRMVVLRVMAVTHVSSCMHEASVMGPPTPEIAPSGYYLLYVIHAGIPSSGVWVKVQREF